MSKVKKFNAMNFYNGIVIVDYSDVSTKIRYFIEMIIQLNRAQK
jgi:hypothetical protein